ncbi:MAG: hypothetical protein H0W48_00070 [Methylibium sp.]|nr:hypothetical protein [Methylibium sp.]
MARKKLTASQIEAEKAGADEQRRFATLKSWFEMENMRQEVNRYQMALDCDYYDGIQWTQQEAAEIRRRGQNPIVFNEVKPTIDWLIGTERRMRRDFKVLARKHNTPEASEDAEVKTQLLKYIDDVNRGPFERSQAFDDCVKAGLGWLEVGITADPEDEPIFLRSESWRYMLHDSLATRRDLSDARYLFRFREIDLDVAQAYFPNKALELEKASNLGDVAQWDDDWAGGWPTSRTVGSPQMPAKFISYNADSHLFNPRKRVSLVECWHIKPTTETTGAPGSSMDRVRMQMHLTIMTRQDIILEAKSPYAHNRYPFVPLWCYRTKKDGMPYGVIRNIRGPQDDLNKRMSKAQFLLSINQMRVEKGAIDDEVMDIDEIRDELAAPDGIAVFADKALSGGKVQIREHGDIAQGHLALADRDQLAIRSVSGVTQENRGQSSAGASGKAILAKQDQGSMVTAEVFDNGLLSHQIEGELCLSLIEQFYDEEKTFSVTGDRYQLDYTTINQTDPATGQMKNAVTRHKADFVIGEAPWRQALAESAFESAMNMLAQLAPVAPQVVTSIIDLVFEWSDIPNKATIVKRIRQATGAEDPDKGESPEQQAAKAKQAQMAEATFQAELAKLQGEVMESQARGEKLNAEAMAKRLESLATAAQAAAQLAAVPGVTPIADELLRSAGFKDANAAPTLQDMPALPAPVEQAAPVADPMGSVPPEADGLVPQAGV